MASHDTIRRVMMLLDPEVFQSLQTPLQTLLNQGEGQKLQKILGIDGKTQRGNKTQTQKPNHILSAIDENGFSIAQKHVNDKTNEIKEVPKLLDALNIANHIITTDALNTQQAIAKKICEKKLTMS